MRAFTRTVVMGFTVVFLVGSLLGCATVEEPTPEEETEDPAVEETEEATEDSAEESPQPEETTEEDKDPGAARVEEDDPASEPQTSRAPSRPATVQDYGSLASRPFEMPEGPKKYDHEYTANRFRSLADALASSTSVWDLDAVQHRQLEDVADTLRDAADAIQRERFDEHSPAVRDALRTAAGGFEAFTDNDDNLEVIQSRLEAIAQELDPGVRYLEQEKDTETYFRQAAAFFDTLYG